MNNIPTSPNDPVNTDILLVAEDRIKGNRRLIVAIQGVCAVATAYIPQCFLRKI